VPRAPVSLTGVVILMFPNKTSAILVHVNIRIPPKCSFIQIHNQFGCVIDILKNISGWMHPEVSGFSPEYGLNLGYFAFFKQHY
jgi:hypothetical protein